MAYVPSKDLEFTITGYIPSYDLSFLSVVDVLDAQETFTDSFLSSGVVTDPNGLVATETATDSYQSGGQVYVNGDMPAVETGNDTFLALPLITGDIGATETLNDSITVNGSAIVSIGSINANELETDSYFTPPNPVTGVLTAQEPSSDNFDSSQKGLSIFEQSTDLFKSLPTVVVANESIHQQNVTSVFYSQSLPDLIIPISTLSVSLNKENTSTANIVIPNGLYYDSLIRAYLDNSGYFTLRYTDILKDGSIVNTESQEFLISSVSSSRGGKNWSIQIGGSNDTVEPSQVSKINLRSASLFRSNTDGSATIRAALDRRLVAGDIAIYDEIEYTTTKITQVANPTNIYMEVSTG